MENVQNNFPDFFHPKPPPLPSANILCPLKLNFYSKARFHKKEKKMRNKESSSVGGEEPNSRNRGENVYLYTQKCKYQNDGIRFLNLN